MMMSIGLVSGRKQDKETKTPHVVLLLQYSKTICQNAAGNAPEDCNFAVAFTDGFVLGKKVRNDTGWAVCASSA